MPTDGCSGACFLQVSTNDSTLSYLPLAHIFDRIVEEFALFSGARIGYFQVHPAILEWLDRCPWLQDTHCAVHSHKP